jgi:hypothetical protein
MFSNDMKEMEEYENFKAALLESTINNSTPFFDFAADMMRISINGLDSFTVEVGAGDNIKMYKISISDSASFTFLDYSLEINNLISAVMNIVENNLSKDVIQIALNIDDLTKDNSDRIVDILGKRLEDLKSQCELVTCL